MTIIGKVKNKKDLFFIDYSDEEIAVNSIINNIKILEIYDQFYHKLDYIPKGWQTIVKLNYKNSRLSAEIDRIETFNTWGYNKNSIKI